LREDRRLTVFENRVLRRIFGRGDEVTGEWRRLHKEVKKVKFSLEQATKAQRGSRVIALLFL
jgi:hypothetical protein